MRGGSVFSGQLARSGVGLGCGVVTGEGLGEKVGAEVGRDEGDVHFAFKHSLVFEDFEHGGGDLFVLGDFLEGEADDVGAHGGGFGKFDGGLTFGGGGDDGDLVGSVLFDGRGDLAKAVDDFFFDLADHAGVAEVDFTDVNGAEGIAPVGGFGGDFGADGAAHGVAILQHVGEFHVGEAADGGVGDVGAEGAAGVGVFEEVKEWVADEHFIPDADAHGGAFLGVDGLAAEVFLVEAEV